MMKCKGFKCKYLSYDAPHNSSSHSESHMTLCWCNLANKYMRVDTNPFIKDKEHISIKDYCTIPEIIKRLENEKSMYIKTLAELENI